MSSHTSTGPTDSDPSAVHRIEARDAIIEALIASLVALRSSQPDRPQEQSPAPASNVDLSNPENGDWVAQYDKIMTRLSEILQELRTVWVPLLSSEDLYNASIDITRRLETVSKHIASDFRPTAVWTQLRRLGIDLERFLSEFVASTPLRQDATAPDMKRIRAHLREWSRDVRAANTGRGLSCVVHAGDIASLFEQLNPHLEELASVLTRFVHHGIPSIKEARHRQFVESMRSLSTMATFLSAVTATMLQYSTPHTEKPIDRTVNFLWITSLMLSIAGAAESQAASFVDVTHYSRPKSFIALTSWFTFNVWPPIYVIAAVITFGAGLFKWTTSNFGTSQLGKHIPQLPIVIECLLIMFGGDMLIILLSFMREHFRPFTSLRWRIWKLRLWPWRVRLWMKVPADQMHRPHEPAPHETDIALEEGHPEPHPSTSDPEHPVSPDPSSLVHPHNPILHSSTEDVSLFAPSALDSHPTQSAPSPGAQSPPLPLRSSLSYDAASAPYIDSNPSHDPTTDETQRAYLEPFIAHTPLERLSSVTPYHNSRARTSPSIGPTQSHVRTRPPTRAQADGGVYLPLAEASRAMRQSPSAARTDPESPRIRRSSGSGV